MAAPAKTAAPAPGNSPSRAPKADPSKNLRDELKQLRADYNAQAKKIRREILLQKAEALK